MFKKAKKMISVLMVIVMFLTMSPLDGLVGLELFDIAWFNVSATHDGFVYEILNGTYCKINAYEGGETEVAIPAEINGYIVQRIENSAFKNNTKIEKVVFPETVETMGNEVFRGCTSLTSITIPDSITNISEGFFSRCSSINFVINFSFRCFS